MALINENDNRYSQRLWDISNKYKKDKLEAILADALGIYIYSI